MVAAELGIDTTERGVTVGLRLLDTIDERIISEKGLFSLGSCNADKESRCVGSHADMSLNAQTIATLDEKTRQNAKENRFVRTRYGEPSGCCGAGRRSLTLKRTKALAMNFDYPRTSPDEISKQSFEQQMQQNQRGKRTGHLDSFVATERRM